MAACARRLGLPEPPQSTPDDEHWRSRGQLNLSQRRALRLFTEAFTASEIAQPLRSFDSEHGDEALRSLAMRDDLEVSGLRRGGVCVGYLCPRTDAAHPRGELMRAFAPAQIVPRDAPLSEVVHVLTHYDFCFVTAMGDVAGVITRGDMQQPVVRMWLFGIITLMEMELLERIRERWPDGSWTALLSSGRLDKAQTLLDERRRRGQHIDLADCLQLSDKAQVLMEDEQQRLAFGLRTKGAAKRVIKDLESLRNNLAHAQDIVTYDWPQIARLARHIEERLRQHDGG